MKAPKWPKIPPEHRKTIENYQLLMRAELGDLDSRFFARFADAQPSDLLPLLEAHCLVRFDTAARYFRFLTASDHPTALVTFEKVLEVGEEKALNFLREVLSSVPESVQGDTESRVALKLKSQTFKYLAEARLKQHDRVSRATPKIPIVTSGTIKRRRAQVRAYCREHDLTMPDLARKVGISVTAIRGIIREDRIRYGEAAQKDLLEVLQITPEQWYERESPISAPQK